MLYDELLASCVHTSFVFLWLNALKASVHAGPRPSNKFRIALFVALYRTLAQG